MITVHIPEIDTCSLAVQWCRRNLPGNTWDMDTQWPANGYNFKFKDAQSATLFSLKWAGIV